MKTKKSFLWHRSYSAFPGDIEIPAGTPVQYFRGQWWVHPIQFPAGSIEQHDALHYGCRVESNNVEPGHA